MPEFDPRSISTLRFTARSISPDGLISLHYALDEAETFVETFTIPLAPGTTVTPSDELERLLDLLHWVAGVSYYKMAAPPEVSCETGPPPSAARALLHALYSEGLGEFAYENHDRLGRVPRPTFPSGEALATPRPAEKPLRRVLVPVGGGKDSIVALEAARRSGLDLGLFVVNPLGPMRRTARVAELPLLEAHRQLPVDDIRRLNSAGALNGHVPITAIIACVALVTAKLNGYDAVALANERSASAGNLVYDGITINHQFSKSREAEVLLRAASREADPTVDIFSLLRPVSELSIARTFARELTEYHQAFTSCNRNFHIDPAQRGAQAWCRDCPKCRFVFLMLAPFMEPAQLTEIFGGALLDTQEQFPGFALLTATGGHKPFECVGEEEESLSAIELLADDPRWRDRPVVQRLVAEVLVPAGARSGRITDALAINEEHHDVPRELMDGVRAFLAT